MKSYLNYDQKDAESYFLLSLAYTQRNQFDLAQQSVQMALDLGLPAERFIAAPRRLIKPLFDHRPHLRSTLLSTNQIIHGPMIGSVTDQSAKIWCRVADASVLKLRFWMDGQQRPLPKTVSQMATTNQDYTVVFQLSQLQPNTPYQFEVGDSKRHWGKFETLPPEGQAARFRLAFGGGAGYVPVHERMWQTIQRFEPRMLLLLGDNIYSDDPTRPEQQKYCYYRRQSRPEYRQLVQQTPVYTIWDDHDFSTNDSWGGQKLKPLLGNEMSGKFTDKIELTLLTGTEQNNQVVGIISR